MINANELRLGNWIKNGFNQPIKINGIISEGNTGGYALKTLSPIPLTAEILEKAGFKDNILLLGEQGVCSYGWHLIASTYKGISKVNLAYDYDDCAYESHNAEHQTEIKYLHQLQNLYFALTGQELEISL